ncbi:MAG TPA: hypothetical protein PLA68_12900 [Panacibacter sp.]|nr:hypothetical protein [Panacibacter sp.]
MKKSIISISLIFLVTVAVFYNQITSVLRSEKPIYKEISLTIATGNNYSATAYDNALASVHVTVYKISGNKQTIVWDKTFDTMQLKKYPNINQALPERVAIPNILESKEKLVVTYTVTYDTKGSLLKMANGAVVTSGEETDKLFIGI